MGTLNPNETKTKQTNKKRKNLPLRPCRYWLVFGNKYYAINGNKMP